MREHASADFRRVFDIITYQKVRCPQSRALNHYHQGAWQSCSIGEFEERVSQLTGWFIREGYRVGDRVAIVPRGGNLFWMIIDLAAQQAGLVQVPVHPSSPLEEVEFIVMESSCRLVIAADSQLHGKLLPLKERTGAGIHHLEVDQPGRWEPVFAERHAFDRKAVDDRRSQVTEEDTLAILYTSGSSGKPKGVILSHRNVASSIKSVLSIFPVSAGDRVLSFLPVSHVFERTTLYSYLALGAEIWFSRSSELLLNDFRRVRPVFCTSVPRMLEKMYEYLQELTMKNNPVVRPVVQWTLALGERYPDRIPIPFTYRLQLTLARWLVLNRWRNKLGGKLRYMAVGAAALRPEIGRLLSASGILTLNGYGMTEASPYISVNRTEPGLNRFGTVGLPVPGVQIRIDHPDESGEGEVWVSGPNITRGYLNRPELTAEVLTADGWLKTGDIGKMVDRRFLALTSRKSEIFKTSTGKFVAPQPIENLLTSSVLIQQAMVVGLNRPFVSAVIVPNFSALRAWCESEKVHWTAAAYMVHNIKVIRKFEDELERLNALLQGFERIRKFHLAEQEWTVESNDLTTSLKLRRRELQSRFSAAIDKLYED